MIPSAAIPSLMDDVDFLAALDSLEGEPALEEADRMKRLAALRPLAPPINRAAAPQARQEQPPRPASEPIIPRDVNRWFLEAPPNVGQEAAISGHMATLSFKNNKKIIWDDSTNKYHFS